MPRGATLATGFRNLPAVLADSRGLRRVAGTIARRFESSAPAPYGNQWGAVQAIACSGAMANSSRLSERPSRTSRPGMRTLYQGWLFVVGPREFPPTYAHSGSRNDNDRALAHRVAMVLDQDPHGRHSLQWGHLDKPHDGWMRPATQKDEFPGVRVLGDQQALLLVGQRQQRLVCFAAGFRGFGSGPLTVEKTARTARSGAALIPGMGSCGRAATSPAADVSPSRTLPARDQRSSGG